MSDMVLLISERKARTTGSAVAATTRLWLWVAEGAAGFLDAFDLLRWAGEQGKPPASGQRGSGRRGARRDTGINQELRVW